MANVAIARTALAAGALSADLITAAAQIKSIPHGDVGVFSVAGNTSNLVFTFYSASGTTIQVSVGDNPPSLVNIDDSAVLTLTAGAVYIYTLPGGRYMQDDGTVLITNVGSTNAVIASVQVLSREMGAN